LNQYPPYKIFLGFVIVFLFIGLFLFVNHGDKLKIIVPRPPEISGIIIHPADEVMPATGSTDPEGVPEFPAFINPVDIEFPAGNREYLLPFVNSVKNTAGEGGQARILHYGDSQLEGDRVTAHFRSRLQKEYGGSGPGMIPLTEPVYESDRIVYKQTGNWIKYDKLVNQRPLRHYGMGTMLSYSLYREDPAYLVVNSAGGLKAGNNSFDFVRLILLPGRNEGMVSCSAAGSFFREWAVPPGGTLIQLSAGLGGQVCEARFDFRGLEGVIMFGLSLETENGIIVDNIAHRGSAGLEFSRDEPGSFAAMAGFIKPGLIILQFGINVVPAKTENFSYYGLYLEKEIDFIRGQVPGVPILVVGVSDMGHLVNSVPAAYSSVEKVSAIQREAAAKTGAAFFDLLEFMGGPGSFIRWIEADPPLMRSDFTHFTHAGGALVAEGIAGALIKEINKKEGAGGHGF